MMGRRNLIILLCILFAALATFFGIQGIRKSARGERRKDAHTVLTTVTGENLSKISCLFDQSQMTFLCENGDWIYADDPELPLNPDIPRRMADIVTTLTSVRTIGKCADKSEYGITPSSIRVTAEGKDGSSYGFTIGSYVGFSDGCYVMVNGDENIYFVPGEMIAPFSHHSSDLVEMEPIPEIGNVHALCVESSTQRFEALRDAQSDAWYSLINGERAAINAINARATAGMMSRLEWSGCVDYDAAEEDMARYGLDTPTVITASYTDTDDALRDFALCVGSAVGSGYYARLPGSPMVLLIQGELVSPLLNASLDQLRTEP